jgi:predicted naringenin-chalcone synthase
MTWIVGDSGFEMTLGRQVPGLIGRYLGPWLREWLERQGLSITDIATWAVHPGGPRILDAVEQALALPEQSLAVSRAVLAEHGNMSSPTLLFILEKLMAVKTPTPCVMLGFGPGLAVEAALFR